MPKSQLDISMAELEAASYAAKEGETREREFHGLVETEIQVVAAFLEELRSIGPTVTPRQAPFTCAIRGFTFYSHAIAALDFQETEGHVFVIIRYYPELNKE